MTESDIKGPYTAIIVGSGCSVGLGVPVMAGFLDSVMDSLATDLRYANDLNAIQAFINRIKGAAAYVKADLLNIEELYGMADMYEDLYKAPLRTPSKESNTREPKSEQSYIEVKQSLNRAIFQIAAKAGEEFISQKDRFPKDLKELSNIKRESSTETHLHNNLGTRWTNLLAYLCLASFQDRNKAYPMFVQFNWDLALDRALYLLWAELAKRKDEFQPEDRPWLPWYGDIKGGIFKYSEWPRLARPHGGVNWINDEESILSNQKIIQEKCYKLYSADPESLVYIDTKPVCKDSGTEYEWSNGKFMDIVPPTWRKQATKPVYQAQWGNIAQGMKNIRRIIFIGYSLPKTDLYFRHFLALSLANNPHLPKVYVLNPDIDKPGIVRDNYLDLFAPLAREGRLYGIKGRFGDPALFDLHRALRLATPIYPDMTKHS